MVGPWIARVATGIDKLVSAVLELAYSLGSACSGDDAPSETQSHLVRHTATVFSFEGLNSE
jgi:hypothetical protein